MLAHHRLRARTGRHPFGFDADHATRSRLVGVRDSDQRIGLLAALAADRRPAFETELGAQPHVGADRTLATHDLARDRFGEALDSCRLRVARKHVERRLFENLGEARHVHAGLVGGEVGDHRELGVVNLRASIDLKMHDAAYVRDARAIEREPNLRLFRLAIGIEVEGALAFANSTVDRRRDQMRSDFVKRRDVVRAALEMRLYDLAVVDEEIDVDRASREPARSARAPDGALDITCKALERFRIQLRAQPRRDIEVSRAIGPVRGLRLVERRNGRDLRSRAQTLKGGENVPLPVTEVRANANEEIVHFPTLRFGGPEFRTQPRNVPGR